MIPIADIQWFSLSDYPGVPSAILFTQGCNLACKYCHNKQLIPIQEANKQHVITLGKVLAGLEERKGKLEGVVITGGEPLVHNDLLCLLTEIKQIGFKVKLDTNGTFPGVLIDIIEQNIIDYVALDIKAPWDKYKDITKLMPLDVHDIKTSLEILEYSTIPYEVRTTFDRSVLTEADLETIKTYFPKNVLHRINECVK